MNYLKILGLAAVAALALMALGAAGSASADVLCKNKTTTEACSEIYPAGTGFKVELVTNGIWALESVEPMVHAECKAAKFESSTENAGAEAEAVFISVEPAKYSFGSCNFTPVTVTEGGKYEIGEWVKGTDNGTMRISNFRITVNLIFGSCIWKTVGAVFMGTVNGGAPATITSTNVRLELAAGGGICPKEVTMRAPYKIVAPNPLYVAKK